MLQFKKIGLEDRELVSRKLEKLNCKLLNYNFIVMYIYRDIIHFEYAVYGDFLVVKTLIDGKEQFLFPVGEGDPFPVLDEIKNYAFEKGENCHFFQFCEENAQVLLSWIEMLNRSGSYTYELYDVRSEFEYIYAAKDLIELQGSAFKPKRNHVNHFLKSYSWTEEIIDESNLPEVVAYSKAWDKAREIDGQSRLLLENQALYEALDHYFELGIRGLLIRIEGEITAFSIGCPLCDDTYLVLFEKADWRINGSYAMINREFVKVIAEGYPYINRAEDGGVEGLRKAKMSYNPLFLQKVYHLDLFQKIRKK